jgi:hypothetical protein
MQRRDGRAASNRDPNGCKLASDAANESFYLQDPRTDWDIDVV